MNQQKDRKLIILGLTGPVGSGCTEFSKIFDNDVSNRNREAKESELIKYLSKTRKFIKINKKTKKVIPLHSDIDEDIRRLYVKLKRINSDIDKLKELSNKKEIDWININIKSIITSLEEDSSKLKASQKLNRRLFNEIKEQLEIRETLKSLDSIEDYIDFDENPLKHHFRRISISDLIIFYTLINKPQYICTVKHKNDKNRKKSIYDYKSIITSKEILREMSKETHKLLNKIIAINPQDKNLSEILMLLRKNYNTNQIVEILRQTVELIRSIKKKFKNKRRIKKYRTLMQDFGDNIRRTKNPYNYSPLENPGKILNDEVHLSLAKDVDTLINFLFKERNHSFFIIDSFRNPYEALYFRKKYIDFYLISLFATKMIREERLQRKYNYFDKDGEERDQGKSINEAKDQFYMQNVIKTVKFSDIAINNDKNLPRKNNKLIKDEIIKKFIRYLALIFDAGCTKPTDDEVMMNLAYTMSMKSNCISRQVGAVIEGKEGYIVGAGWNDVGEGKISCGLREIKDLALKWNDKYVNIFKDSAKNIMGSFIGRYENNLANGFDEAKLKKFCFCFKDEYSKIEFIKKLDKLSEEHNFSEALEEKIKEELEVKRLEYCEALHAEENAIIQSSKIGGMGLIDGKIYTTSFPCELCAKKIQQVGISEIVYTEPYPGISEAIYLKNALTKIEVTPFEGVMPHKYFQLFKVVDDQKEWQEMNSKGLVD